MGRRTIAPFLVAAAVGLTVAGLRFVREDAPQFDSYQVEDLTTCNISPADGEGAIAAAISSCPNGSMVQFPRGIVYRQAKPIDVVDRTNLVIDGGGSTFASSAPNTTDAYPNWRIIGGRGVTLRNMTVEGNFKTSGPRDIRAVSTIAQNQYNSGFFLQGGEGLTIADVEIRDVFGDFVTVLPLGWVPGNAAVHTEIPRNIRLLRINGTRAARQCIAVTAAIKLWLTDSLLRDCWYGGVDLEPDVVGEPVRDIHILRNTLDGYNLFAVAVPFPGNDGDVNGIEIRGNKTLTAGDACLGAVIVGYHPSSANRVRNVVTEDNEFKVLGSGILYDHVDSGSIVNNRIERIGTDALCAPPLPVPINVTNSVEVRSAGNTTVGYKR